MRFSRKNLGIFQNKMKICSPALLFLILSVLGTIFMVMTEFSLLTLFFNVLFIALWTWFLNFLCLKGHETVSWILVILPYVFMILFLFISIDLMKNLSPAQIRALDQMSR